MNDKLYYEQFPMVTDQEKGARGMSTIVGCTTRRIFHLVENCRFPYERVGTTLCLRRSVFYAWLWAQAQTNAKWNLEEYATESALVEMNLAVRKAAALIEQLRLRQMAVQSLNPDQLACFATVMESAVLAADRAITAKAG